MTRQLIPRSRVIHPYSLQKHDVTITKKGGNGYGLNDYLLGIFAELGDKGLSGCSGVVGAERGKGGLFPECPVRVLPAGCISEDSIAAISCLDMAELRMIE